MSSTPEQRAEWKKQREGKKASLSPQTSTPEQRAYWKKQREKHRTARAAYQHEWCGRNKEKIKTYNNKHDQTPERKAQFAKSHKEYYQKHKEEIRLYQHQYSKDNKERLKLLRKKSYLKHRKKRLKQVKDYQKTPAGKAVQNRHNKKRRATPHFRLRERVSRGVYYKLKNHKGKKYNASIDKLLPYTIEELTTRLESMFKPGMTWDNMGKWHLDHIIPDSSFDYETTSCPGFKKSWALENLQPLWAEENLRKGSKMPAFSNITEA